MPQRSAATSAATPLLVLRATDHFHAAREDVGRENRNTARSSTTRRPRWCTHRRRRPRCSLTARAFTSVGIGRSRTIALSDFLLPPDFDRNRDTTLGRDEVLTHVSVPAVAANTRAAYHKQTERDSYDWPICDVAVVLTLANRQSGSREDRRRRRRPGSAPPDCERSPAARP